MKRTYLYSSFWSIAVLILIAYACEKSEVNPDDHSISIDEVDGRSFQKTSQTLYRVTSDNFDKNNFVISPS